MQQDRDRYLHALFCVCNPLSDDCHFLCSPFAYVDPLHCNMAYLYLELLKDSLNEYAYAAELAGLNYDLQNTVYGMYVSIHSFPPHPVVSLYSASQTSRLQPLSSTDRVRLSQASVVCLQCLYCFLYTVETLNRFISSGKCNLNLTTHERLGIELSVCKKLTLQ